MRAKILITGATGNTGAEVVRQLLVAGHRVRALVHSDASAAGLPSGAEPFVGSFDDPEALGQAFVGIEAAYLLTPVHQNNVAWMRRMIDAATRAGVHHVVKLSGMTAGPQSPSSLIRDHGAMDDYLRETELSHTIIQPNSFMQNLLWSAASIKAQGAFYQPTGEARQSVVDIGDVAAVVVKALTEPGHARKTYVLTGPEALTFHEIASKLGAVIGKPVQYVPVPGVAAEQSMLGAGMATWNAHALVEFFTTVATGAFAAVTRDVEQVLGRPATSFDAFAARHASLFT